MNDRRLAIIPLIALCLIGCGSAEREQKHKQGQEPGGVLMLERWPGEGVPVLAWQGPGDSLEVYARPGAADAVRSIAVRKGQKLLWDRSLVRIEQPGQMEITGDCISSGFVYDPPEDGRLEGGRAREIYLPSGALLEVVCYAAEGFYIFRHQGEYIEMGVGQPCQRMLAEPQTRWWVRMIAEGQPMGWIRADEKRVAVVDRRF